MFEEEIVNHREVQGARIVLGDFNESMRGIVSRTLKTHLQHADIRYHLKRSRTYPGVLPIFSTSITSISIEGLKLEKPPPVIRGRQASHGIGSPAVGCRIPPVSQKRSCLTPSPRWDRNSLSQSQGDVMRKLFLECVWYCLFRGPLLRRNTPSLRWDMGISA